MTGPVEFKDKLNDYLNYIYKKEYNGKCVRCVMSSANPVIKN